MRQKRPSQGKRKRRSEAFERLEEVAREIGAHNMARKSDILKDLQNCGVSRAQAYRAWEKATEPDPEDDRDFYTPLFARVEDDGGEMWRPNIPRFGHPRPDKDLRLRVERLEKEVARLRRRLRGPRPKRGGGRRARR